MFLKAVDVERSASQLQASQEAKETHAILLVNSEGRRESWDDERPICQMKDLNYILKAMGNLKTNKQKKPFL